MIKINLLTRNGELVTVIDLPLLNPPAEIVQWTSAKLTRSFVRHPSGEYREAQIWYSHQAAGP